MRRTKHLAGVWLIAVLLVAGLAPAVAADVPQSLDGWFGMLGQSFGIWWSALTGDNGDRGGLTAASELAPSIDPDGQELAPSLDSDGAELAPSIDPDGNELASSLDPNG